MKDMKVQHLREMGYDIALEVGGGGGGREWGIFMDTREHS